ncbi:MAG: hypothetical protein LUH14_03955 [Clostridiaceae bacterium]|nr:hypothetical protein [Clostridiaceae bacterium]
MKAFKKKGKGWYTAPRELQNRTDLVAVSEKGSYRFANGSFSRSFLVSADSPREEMQRHLFSVLRGENMPFFFRWTEYGAHLDCILKNPSKLKLKKADGVLDEKQAELQALLQIFGLHLINVSAQERLKQMAEFLYPGCRPEEMDILNGFSNPEATKKIRRSFFLLHAGDNPDAFLKELSEVNCGKTILAAFEPVSNEIVKNQMEHLYDLSEYIQEHKDSEIGFLFRNQTENIFTNVSFVLDFFDEEGTVAYAQREMEKLCKHYHSAMGLIISGNLQSILAGTCQYPFCFARRYRSSDCEVFVPAVLPC